MTTPSIGRVVIVRNFSSNGTDDQPAITNRVWRDDPLSATSYINCTVLPDCGTPTCVTSVTLFADERAAQQYLDTLPVPQNKQTRVAFWPDRV